MLRSRYLQAKIPRYDLQLKVTPADDVGRRLYKHQEYEPELSQALERHVAFQPDDVFIDVGANIGWYSLLVHRLSAGKCRSFAFEPDPDNFALLQHNLALNGASAVTAFNLAVGERAATLQLHRYRRSNSGRHSLLAIHAGETIPVKVVSLDAFWRERGLGDGPIRLLKMDIEGYELMALRGATAVLQRCEWLLLEHSPPYMRKAGLDPAAMVDLLVNTGFAPLLPGTELGAIPIDELRRDGSIRNVLWHRAR